MKKSTRLKVCLNHQYLQGSWNFERMQNGGWCYGLLPALKELYPNKEDYDLAVDRHLKFYNTHPYVSAPIVGIVLAMEEEKAKSADISDTSIQDVKIGLMGPLAGVGDPVFWFTMRPILAAVGASLALSQNILGPIFFFVAWNVLRFGFLWITQELGYKKGTKLITDLSDTFLKNVTLAASMLGMFVIGSSEVCANSCSKHSIRFRYGIAWSSFFMCILWLYKDTKKRLFTCIIDCHFVYSLCDFRVGGYLSHLNEIAICKRVI